MKKQNKQDKMIFGTPAVGSVKSVRSTEAVLVIDNLSAHFEKMLKK